MKLGNYDFLPRTGTHESFKDWRPDKVQQLSGNRIRLTAGSSWSAGVTGPVLGLGTLTVEFDCRVQALDPRACLAVWRYDDETKDEYDDVEFCAWGDANKPESLKTTVWDKGKVYMIPDIVQSDIGTEVVIGEDPARRTANPKGFRRYRVVTIENEWFFVTTVYGWWWHELKDKTWAWDWKVVASSELPKPEKHTPGRFKIALWIPTEGLLYPASASAPLVAVINKCEFVPSEVAESSRS